MPRKKNYGGSVTPIMGEGFPNAKPIKIKYNDTVTKKPKTEQTPVESNKQKKEKKEKKNKLKWKITY